MTATARAEQLRAAVMTMTDRYADSRADYAFAVVGGYHADEKARLLRAQRRQYRALQRLTRALADLAGGAR